MNTNQNKAALWKSCVEQGIFDKVPASMTQQVQGLFERTIREFDNDNNNVSITNQLFSREFKLRLAGLTGISISTTSFEDTEKEYNAMLQSPKPTDIDFTQERDSPIENLSNIIEEKTKQREMDISQLFNDEHKNKVLGITPPTLNQFLDTRTNNNTNSNVNQNELFKMIQSQNKVLQRIVESQIQIIDILSKSNKK